MCPQRAQGQCIDFYNLDADYVKCEIGPYAARTGGANWTVQKVDEGPGDQTSRHTVHRSASEVDARTTFDGTHFGLHTVPEGEVASIRLGNWLDGRDVAALYNDCGHYDNYTGEAERITYTFTVTDENKYILLRYAIVWENPNGHNDVLPSFQIETLLGASGENHIDGPCYSFDKTVGNSDLDYVGKSHINHRVCNTGWGSSGTKLTNEEHDVAWRDWRTRIVNLEDYVGQTVRLRITSSDCGHKGHFGYSYFTLRCLDVNLYSPTCGGPTEYRTFTAPTGLNYIWYKLDNNNLPTDLLPDSTNTITVLNDGQRYECYIASPENANCHIELFAHAEPRVPLAKFSIDKHEACVDTIFLTDESAVSHDGVIPIFPHEDVDAVVWDLGDGRSNATYTPGTPIVYDADGTYTIKQIAILTNGSCTDTLERTVTVRGRETKHEGEVYDTICAGDVYTWNGSDYTSTGVYPYIMPNAAAGGFCDSIARLHLKVWDTYFYSDAIDVLEGKQIPYIWHRNGSPKNLYTSGVYYDSCYSVHGCDSVYKLVMTVRPKYFHLDSATICQGEEYIYHKNGAPISYSKQGIYYDSLLTNIYGNDSVYCLKLTVHPSYHDTTVLKFCEGDTITFHGQRFWTDGPHDVHFTSRHGCDSAFTVVMQKQKKWLIDVDTIISDKQRPFIWHNKNCSNTGTYYDSLKTVEGCDSIIRLNLRVYPTFYQEDVPLTICKDSTVHWHTKYITGTTVGTFTIYDSLTNQYGYDSVYRVQYTVLPSYRVNVTAQRAIGETYHFYNQTITTGGVYTYYGTTEQGCDSIVRLTINFYPTYFMRDSANFCQGGSYTYHKNGSSITYTAPGTYYDSLKTVNGYDSIYCLTLQQLPTYFRPETYTICEGGEYVWHGQTLRTAGEYYDSLLTKSGCDSIYKLTLTVDPSPKIHVYEDICEGEYVMFGGKSRTTGGTYYDSLKTTQTGCDSVRILHLTVRPVPHVTIDIHQCVGDTFTFHGQRITTGCVLHDTVTGVNGCDSITTYNVLFHPVLRDTTHAAICQGETYSFHGHDYTTANIYTLEGQSKYFCDSTYILDLTVHPKYVTDITEKRPIGEHYYFFGRDITTGGIYTDTATSIYGCDSVVRLTITFHPKYLIPELAYICEGTSYTYHKNGASITYTTPGIYWDSLKTVHGYDSVYKLDLRLYPSYHFDESFTICQGDTLYQHGRSFTTAGTYTIPFYTSNGCDSIFTLTLNVNPRYENTIHRTICEGQHVMFAGVSRTTGGLYTEKLTSINGCDSITHLNLTVNPKIRVTLDRHLCEGEYFDFHGQHITTGCTLYDTVAGANGCDSITTYNVYVHPVVRDTVHATICQGGVYTFHGHDYTTAGIHELQAQSRYHCDSTYILDLTVNPKYEVNITEKRAIGEHYYFFGRDITTGGVYTETTTSALGCDSVVRLTITFYPTYLIKDTVYICDSASYTYHKNGASITYTTPGIYWDSLKTVHGYDSVYMLDLRTYPSYHFDESSTICQGDTLYLHGRSFTIAGTYTIPFTTVNGCDSIFSLTVNVNPSYENTIYRTICEDEYVIFDGQSRNVGGYYTEHRTTINGCDSITHLNLTVNPKIRITIDRHLCVGDTFYFHGQHITTGCMVADTVNGSNGCDSITTYNVNFHPVVNDTTWGTICDGETYNFHGHEFKTAGIHELPAQSRYHCDSNYVLVLTVNPKYTTNITEKRAIGDHYYFFGKDITTGGVYVDTTQSVKGCDSVVRLTITFYPKYLIKDTMYICDSTSYTYHKNGASITYTTPGIYWDSLKTVHGYDSVYMLDLRTYPSYHFDESFTICKGDTLYEHGRSFTIAGTYTVPFTTVNGCDSIFTLTLNVNPSYENTINRTICEDEYVIFDGQSRNVGGYYTEYRTTINGCDSITHLNLTVNPKIRITIDRHLCVGDTFNFHGQHITTGGIVSDTVKGSNGCDSITTYNVHFHPVVNDTVRASICEGETYNFHGHLYTDAGTHTLTAQSRYHCDSTHVLILTVNPKYTTNITEKRAIGDTYYFFDQAITTGGVYTYHTTSVKGCDSIIRLTIAFYPTYLINETATFCKGSSYSYHKNGSPITYSAPGTYWDSLTTAQGFDSVYCLTLRELPTYYYEEEKTICQGEEYVWHNQVCRVQRNYYDSLKTAAGCDSVYCLKLTVNPSPVIHVYDNICEGDYVMFGGKPCYTAGMHYDSSWTAAGCDSVRILHLTVRPVPRVSLDIHKCSDDYYNYRGMMLTRDTIFSDTTRAINNCDSITTYNLYFHPVVRDTMTASICEGKIYTYNGHIYNNTGTFIQQTWSPYHCDTTHVLKLKVNPTYNKDTTLALCHGESVSIFGKIYTSGGTYYDTLQTANGCGCDSTYTITINEYIKFFKQESYSLCKGDTLFWHGKAITTAGVYSDSLISTISGCDSVYQMTVTMRYPVQQEIERTILDFEAFSFNGRLLHNSGIYYDTLISVQNGCDSIVKLTLTVLPTYNVNERATICYGQSYLWNGMQLDSTGFYSVTLTSVHNTDSVVNLALLVARPIINEQTPVHISDKEYYVWKGDTLRQTGTYEHTYTSNVTHCDSIVRLRLIVHKTYFIPDTATICANEYYHFLGSTYNQPGDYEYNPGTNIWGYDSIYALHLNVDPTYLTRDTAHICEGEYYHFLGKPLYEGGHYVDTTKTNKGCDSIVHLLLIKHPVNDVNETHTMCKGDMYTWHGHIYDKSGFYHDTIRSATTGCDSLRFSLMLNVQEPFYEETSGEICANEYYNWRGRSLNKNGIYYDSLIAKMPPFCDSVYCLKLTVNPTYEFHDYDTICEGESFMYNGYSYNTAGVHTQYYHTPKGCDSIHHLHLAVIPINRIQYPLHLCDGDYFSFHGQNLTTAGIYVDTTTSINGCYNIATYNVHFHPVVHDTVRWEICQGEGFTFYGQTFYDNGTHVISGQSAYGCDSTHVLELTVHPSYRIDTTFTICSGDYVKCNGKVYDAGGTYLDTLHTLYGCDSIYTIHIDEYPYISDVGNYASICQGDSVEWRDRWIKTAGIYRDTIFHSSGCNDTYELIVDIKPTYFIQLDTTIRSIDYYSFNGKILRTEGVYTDTLTSTRTGCDSIVQLTLHVRPTYFIDDQQYLCQGETYYFNGMALDSTGVYTTTFHPQPNVDSTVTLALTVYKPIIHERTIHISDQETYTWYGEELNRTGTYDSVMTAVTTGCDSIERLRLYVHPTYFYEDWFDLCSDQRYNWHQYSGLNVSGDYYDIHQTDVWGLDSIYLLHLSVHPAYKHDTTVHICEGDYYEFGGEARYEGGRYFYTEQTVNGCDSIFSLSLIRHPVHIIEQQATICKGDAYTWRGMTLTVGGIYDDSLVTTDIYHCDSIYRLMLYTHQPFYQEYVKDICDGDYYDFNGRQLNEPGIYWDSLVTSMNQCDSIYKLDLRVHHTQRVTVYDTICGDEYAMFNGTALYQGGVYKDTLLNIYGCDSIITLYLSKFPIVTKTVPRSICRGDKTPWTLEGQPILVERAGTYVDTLTSTVSGCDSIVELWLAVNETYHRETKGEICANQYYDWRGRLYTETGVYWDSLTTMRTGCDSVFKLDLTVRPSYLEDTSVYLCDFEKFYFSGKQITKTGVYVDSLHTLYYDCDSVHILHAYIHPTHRDSIYERVCLSDTYDFRGTILKADGVYHDTVNDPVSRHCEIYTVNLSFSATSRITGIHVEEACADDSVFAIHTYYIGSRPSTFSLVFDSISHVAGFVDVLNQPFNDIVYAPIPPRDGGTYIRPDYYHGRLTVDNEVCYPDTNSSMDVSLLLRYPSWIIEQNWNDVVALLNEEFNGGYVFSAYEWYVNGVKSNEKGPYIYMPFTMAIGDEVYIAPTRQGEDYAVPSCPITIYDMTPDLVSEYPVFCEPSNMPGRFFLHAAADGDYRVYNISGQVVMSGTYRSGDMLEINTRTTSGCYLVRLNTPKYGVHVDKLILR